MMKKFIGIVALILFGMSVSAKTVHVEALENFTTENPPQALQIKLLEDLKLDEKTLFEANDIINGKIVDVKSPKRLKRNAGFSFIPVSKISGGVESDINENFQAKYTTKLNKGEIAKSAALGVGNHFVKGLSMGYSAVEGAIKNQENNRLKSGAVSLYESSPLSYVEKGEEIVIEKGQIFLLNFKIKEEENLPNYEYESLDTDI